MEEGCDEENEKQIDRSRGIVNIQVTKEERDNCVCVSMETVLPPIRHDRHKRKQQQREKQTKSNQSFVRDATGITTTTTPLRYCYFAQHLDTFGPIHFLFVLFSS